MTVNRNLSYMYIFVVDGSYESSIEDVYVLVNVVQGCSYGITALPKIFKG